MTDFTLPSGRVVQTQDPLFGPYMKAITKGLQDAEEYTYLKFAAVVPAFTREDVAALSREDGIALSNEVTRIFAGRPEEKEVPFGNTSSQPSTEESLAVRAPTMTPRPTPSSE